MQPEPVAGVLLAGGLSRRMGGGDKCLRLLGGRPLLGHVIDRVKPQVGPLALNANGDPERFREFGLPVVADTVPDFAGPLAGILAGMEWAAAHAPGCRWLASFPTDAPFLPNDLVARLREAMAETKAEMVCARSGGRSHPVCGLWPIDLAGTLRRAMVEEGIRKVDLWTARYRLVEVDFPVLGIDPFFNANRPADLETAERLLADCH